jgi:hypothetical protein
MTDSNNNGHRPPNDAIASLPFVTVTVPASMSADVARQVAQGTLDQFHLWHSRGVQAVASIVLPHQAGCDLAVKLLGAGAHEGDWGESLALATAILCAGVFPSENPAELATRMLGFAVMARIVPAVVRGLGAQPSVTDADGAVVFHDAVSGRTVHLVIADAIERCQGRNWRDVAAEEADRIVAGLRMVS